MPPDLLNLYELHVGVEIREFRMKRLLGGCVFVMVATVSALGQIPAGYYDGAAGLSGPQLKTALSHIIRGHTKFSYDYLWTAFYSTDDKPNGTVWDFYSDVQDGSLNGNPPYTFYFGSNQCATTPGYEGACYNREHSFPKSWMGAVEGDTMYTDLFHLYPTDSYVNTRRNNYPYGTVSAPTWISQNGSKLGPCSAAGYTGIVFEPRDEFKGDLARNYFYMATRYESRIASWQTLDPYGDAVMNGTSFPCFELWFKNLLLTWNAADPVSQKEIDRNNTIYNTIQHNRNPFIDHPEYVEMIWADSIGLAPEPTNYPTEFSAHNIKLQWIDATGSVLPDGYLILASTVGYAYIEAPVDGMPIPTGPMAKNVNYGVREVWFTNLIPDTFYYFKMYGYSGSGSSINYKVVGDVKQTGVRTAP